MRSLLINCLVIMICLNISTEVSSAENRSSRLSKEGFKLGIDAVSFNYEEPGLMEEDGSLYGLYARYSVHGADRLMGEVSLNYVWGSLTYDGQTWSGTPVREDTDDWIVEGRVLVGYDYKLKNSKSVIINEPTVTILGGNTPTGMSVAFPQEAIGQGFFSRLIIVHAEPTGIKNTWMTSPDPELEKQLITFITEMRATLTGEVTTITLTPLTKTNGEEVELLSSDQNH